MIFRRFVIHLLITSIIFLIFGYPILAKGAREQTQKEVEHKLGLLPYYAYCYDTLDSTKIYIDVHIVGTYSTKNSVLSYTQSMASKENIPCPPIMVCKPEDLKEYKKKYPQKNDIVIIKNLLYVAGTKIDYKTSKLFTVNAKNILSEFKKEDFVAITLTESEKFKLKIYEKNQVSNMLLDKLGIVDPEKIKAFKRKKDLVNALGDDISDYDINPLEFDIPVDPLIINDVCEDVFKKVAVKQFMKDEIFLYQHPNYKYRPIVITMCPFGLMYLVDEGIFKRYRVSLNPVVRF